MQANFSYIGERMTMSRAIRIYRLPSAVEYKEMRPMEKKDIISCYVLLKKHLKFVALIFLCSHFMYIRRFKIYPVFTQEEVAHVFLPRKDIIFTYVKTVNGMFD